jgi:hypothetical protein
MTAADEPPSPPPPRPGRGGAALWAVTLGVLAALAAGALLAPPAAMAALRPPSAPRLPRAGPSAAVRPPPPPTPARRAAARAACAASRVPPPPPLPPAKAAGGADAVAVIRALGTLAAFESNATLAAFLHTLTREERERIAYESHAVALYLGAEIPALRAAEEAAALAAAPATGPGGARDLAALNGVNVGAGGRPVHETLLMVDAHRGFGTAAAGKARRMGRRGGGERCMGAHAGAWGAPPACRGPP